MRARHRLEEGESCNAVLSWVDGRSLLTRPRSVSRCLDRHRPFLARLGGRPVPGPPVAGAVAAQARLSLKGLS